MIETAPVMPDAWIPVKLHCLACGRPYEVAEGGDPAAMTCPACGTPQSSLFTYAKSVRFEAVEDPAFVRATERARGGDAEGALAALEEAFRGGFDDFERVEHDPAFSTLRADARFPALVRKYRKA